MVETFLSNPIFVEVILPFLLVFSVVFAILQKSEILGKGKRQIDAIVALVIGLITVAFGYATKLIVYLVPVMAVSVVVILVFMILLGMSFKAGDFKMHKGIQWIVGILAVIVIVIALLVFTGWWGTITDWIYLEGDSSQITSTVIFVVAIAIAVIVAAWGKKKDDKDKKD